MSTLEASIAASPSRLLESCLPCRLAESDELPCHGPENTQCELMLVHQLVAPGLADKHPPGHLHEPPASTRLDQNLESKSIAGTANGASGWGAVLVVLVQC